MQFRKLKRRPELDALRGLFLVLMVLVHLPTRFSTFVDQPFGFVSCAAGFVGLSALLVGRIYFGDMFADEAGVRTKLWKRSFRIYQYHLVIVGLVFTVVADFAIRTHRIAILNLLDFYIAHPVPAVIAALLLFYCPPMLDILPMYIIFLFLTPFFLSLAKRVGWRWVLGPSAAVWLWAQFGLRSLAHQWTVQITQLHMPVRESGAFNLFAWQLIWIVGLWLGASSAIGEFPLNRIPAWATSLSAAVCVFFLGVRYSWWGSQLNQQSFGIELEKWIVAPLRLLNMIAFVAVVWWLRKYIARLIAREPLLTLGKASLEVFCAHLFFVFLGLSLLYSHFQHIQGPTAVALIVVTFLCLFVVAFLQVEKRRKQRQQQVSNQAQPVTPAALESACSGSSSSRRSNGSAPVSEPSIQDISS